MDAAFATIAFTDPARAERNLLAIERQLPPGVWARLGTLLAQVPDPDEALNDFERYLREAPVALVGYLEQYPAALHYLLLVFSHSRFLSETLIQQPDLIRWLHRPPGRVGGDRLARMHTPEELREELARFRATHFDLTTSVLLARFKRREYLRIMLRDVLGLATLAETTVELSHLADVILEAALEAAERKLTKAYGAPQYLDAAARVRRSRFVILSLGKLGGQELNYSSDVDLAFLYESDGQTAGGESGAISNAEFFARLGAATLKIITEPTSEGAVFRVDLRLRPEGTRGDIASSLPGALRYYQKRARQWELQMLIKARPSAGVRELGRLFLTEVQPLIFRAESRGQALAAAIEARREMERDLLRRSAESAARNVKISPGGIRDIEFLAQGLQRLFGSGDPWIAASVTGSTLVALQRLHDKGYLSGRDFFRLSTAYQFLREVEHRLQLRDGLQVHTLPAEPREIDRLARCLGIESSATASPGEQLAARLELHFREVRAIYERVLERFEPAAAEGTVPVSPPVGETGAEALLAEGGEHPAFAQPPLPAGLAGDPHARRGIQQFLDAAALDPALAARIERHPEWIARAAELFARSDLAAAMLARHPEEIEIAVGPDGDRIQIAFAAIGHGEIVPASGLDDLRVALRQAMLVLVARSAMGLSQPFETFAALTGVADRVLGEALARLARETAPGVALEEAPFAVLALGRLGSREMDIGSDADLVFVCADDVTAEERGPWRKLAERMVNAVSSHTRHGLLFPVDIRLRPRGTEGEMVQSAAYIEQYCRGEAAGWEAVTFVKARPLAGNLSLAAATLARMRCALRDRFALGDGPMLFRKELARMRERLDAEWRVSPARASLKLAPGGYHDLEYTLGFRALLADVDTGGLNLVEQARELESSGSPWRLDASSAAALADAATLFRSVDHALRIVTGHSLDHPSARQGPTIARVARLLADWRVRDAHRWLDAIDERRAQVIRLYNSLVAQAPTPQSPQ